MAHFRLRLTVAVAVLVALTGAGNAFAAGNITISQVYGGGGNAGATFTNDYIELHNRSAAAVSVTGWSVQYASSAGTTWATTALSGTIAPGGYYLVQEAAGAGGTTPLPTPNATGTIAMSATSGKVALVASAATLTGSCPLASTQDFVGYGAANCFEGAGAAPTLSNTTAAIRGGNGATDTDNNTADFTAGTPNPRNSGSAPTPPPVPEVTIAQIQGATHVSPRNGERVSTTGIVTALRPATSRGFWIQDPTGDGNDATSEGIFVFTSVPFSVARGDSVRVVGTVSEFRAGGSTSTNLAITQLVSPTITPLSTGNPVPAPTVIGNGGRMPPTFIIDNDSAGNVETGPTVFDPAQDGIDFYESLEGMIVQANNAAVVGPTKDFGEFVFLPDNGSWATGIRTPRGGILYRYEDGNPERLAVDDEILRDLVVPRPSKAMVDVDVGDRITSPIVGPLDYSFANFKIQAMSTLVAASGNLQPETTFIPRYLELQVATFNVENLDPSDGPTIGRLASQIVDNMRAPDLIGIEEVQDNTGATNDGVVDASQSWSLLISAIEAAGGPTYQYRQIDPVNNQDGGQPGGNIRVGFLFRNDRGLQFVDRPGGTSTNSTNAIAGPSGVQLTFSPGRINSPHPGFANTRKSLAGEFTYRGRKLFVVVNHFSSKGEDQPLFGRFQPPARLSEVARHQQAQVVNDFADELFAVDPRSSVIVLGDINDFEFSRTVEILEGGVLTTLMKTLPPSERYSYVFEGNSQVLDQILVSNNLIGVYNSRYDVVHVNAEFASQASDHDPQVAAIRLPQR